MNFSVDGAATTLVDSFSNVHRGLQLLSARQSEVESRLALETEENKVLKEREKNVAEKESDLKKDLERLTRDYHSLQLLLLSERDQFSRCEVEEPLLVKHATEKVVEKGKKATEWKQKVLHLEQLANVFKNDVATNQIKEHIRQTQADIRLSVETQKSLEEELDEVKKAIRNLAKQAQCKELLLLSTEELSQSAENSSADQVEEESYEERASRRRMDAEWSQQWDQFFLEYSAIHREVSDLHHRSEEMSKWLHETQQSRLYYEALRETLEKCVSSQLCYSCFKVENR